MTDFVPDIPRLEEAFRKVDARMRGLPIHNPTLDVVAAFFRPWGGVWVGVMITPWAINLVILPGGSPDWHPLGADQHQSWQLPSGEYTCMGMELEGFGPLQFCSLFSPTHQFERQADAITAARAAMEALMEPAVPSAAPPVATATPAEETAPAPVSRRDFLRGRLFGRKSS